MAKKTALYDMHKKYGGDIVDYAGWDLSVKFEGLVPEHMAVREKAGLFDVSHMGEIDIKGKDAEKFVQYLNTNDLSVLVDNQIAYGFMCYENGTVVDDLLTYKYNNEHYLLVVNASNVEKDVEWINKQKEGFDVVVTDLSDDISEVALQGPLAEKILQKLVDFDVAEEVKFFFLKENVKIGGANTMISRTGYTGEDGFEVYFANDDAETVWEAIMEAGKEDGLVPVGLGCRDTLRFEASLPLYGHEISDEVTPLEGGFGYFVKVDKEAKFIGQEALQAQKNGGLTRKVVGFELLGKGIPREGYDVEVDGKKIGYVTTGYKAPSVGKSIGFALVDLAYTELGTKFDIKIRNKTSEAVVISKKFLQKKK